MASITSKPMQQAEAFAAEIDKGLRADDPRFNGWCRVSMDDGSFFLWDAAFYEIHEVAGAKWVMVFTEHYGTHVFDEEDAMYRHGEYRR